MAVVKVSTACFTFMQGRARLKKEEKEKLPKNGSLIRLMKNRGSQRLQAILAEQFSFEIRYVVGIAAENTGGFVFLKNDSVLFNVNFKGVTVVNIHVFSDFDGEHDSSELIHFSYHSCRFHNRFPFRGDENLQAAKSLPQPTAVGESAVFVSIIA